MIVPDPGSHLIGVLDTSEVLISTDSDIEFLLRARIVVLHRPTHSNDEIISKLECRFLVLCPHDISDQQFVQEEARDLPQRTT